MRGALDIFGVDGAPDGGMMDTARNRRTSARAAFRERLATIFVLIIGAALPLLSSGGGHAASPGARAGGPGATGLSAAARGAENFAPPVAAEQSYEPHTGQPV